MLNEKSLVPRKDYDKDRLETAPLQVGLLQLYFDVAGGGGRGGGGA